MKIVFNKQLSDPAYIYDAGIDIPFVPLSEDNCVMPGSYDTGISVDIPQGYMGLLLPRSSFAQLGGNIIPVPIDSGYKGTIHMFVQVPNKYYLPYKPNTPIAQLVIIPIVTIEPITSSDILKLKQRNKNWCNSTGERKK